MPARIVDDIERATGMPLHVLSHEEEAYLTLVGVTVAPRSATRPSSSTSAAAAPSSVPWRPGAWPGLPACGSGPTA